MNVVLERIGNETISDPDPRLALVVQPLQPERIEHVVIVGVVAELHVAADIPGETLWIDEAGGESARAAAAIDQNMINMSELLQAVRGTESGGAGADDEDSAWIVHRGR